MQIVLLLKWGRGPCCCTAITGGGSGLYIKALVETNQSNFNVTIGRCGYIKQTNANDNQTSLISSTA